MEKNLLILMLLIVFNSPAQDDISFNPVIGQEWNDEGELLLTIVNTDSVDAYFFMRHRHVVNENDADDLIHVLEQHATFNLDRDFGFTSGWIGIGCLVPVRNSEGQVVYERYQTKDIYYRKKRTRSLVPMRE